MLCISNSSSIQDDYPFTVNGEIINLRGVLAAFVGDTPACNEVAGFKVGGYRQKVQAMQGNRWPDLDKGTDIHIDTYATPHSVCTLLVCIPSFSLPSGQNLCTSSNVATLNDLIFHLQKRCNIQNPMASTAAAPYPACNFLISVNNCLKM